MTGSPSRQRISLVLLWLSTAFVAVTGPSYLAAVDWLNRHTILVHVVDTDGQPIAGAEVAKAAPLQIFN